MSDDVNPWTLPEVAIAQRELVDQQLQDWESHPQFRALVDAVRFTKCPGNVIEVGCGSGYNREVLDRAGVEYKTFAGMDINRTALILAKERYPESDWWNGELLVADKPGADVIIDGSCILHVEDWKAHIAKLCAASRRWVILHRIPLADDTRSSHTRGYGQEFNAWAFAEDDIAREMGRKGFEQCAWFEADGDSQALVFAKPRRLVTYADGRYLTRLKALHASLVKHAGPFRLHVLAWDYDVTHWCRMEESRGVTVTSAYDFMKAHPELEPQNLPGPARTQVEHYWTCGPRLIADVMKETGEPVTYLDADLFAFSSLEPMFAEIGGAPAGFVGHNFAKASDRLPGPTIETHGAFGLWNVGVLSFSDIAIANRWAEMCRLWCYDRVERVEAEGGPVPQDNRRLRYGDQKFLEDLCEEFPDICRVTNVAAMCGPWNIHTRAIDVRDGVVHFGGRPLGLFHFSGLRELPDGHSTCSRPEYMVSQRQEAIIYRPYFAALDEAKR